MLVQQRIYLTLLKIIAIRPVEHPEKKTLLENRRLELSREYIQGIGMNYDPTVHVTMCLSMSQSVFMCLGQ